MPIRKRIISYYMAGPRLADLALAALAEAPPAPAAGVEGPPPSPRLPDAAVRAIKDVTFEVRSLYSAVSDSMHEPSNYAYRTERALLDRLPPDAAAIRRRLDRAATEATAASLARQELTAAAAERHRAARAHVAWLLDQMCIPELRSIEDLGRADAILQHYPETQRDQVAAKIARVKDEARAIAEAEDDLTAARAAADPAGPRVIALRHHVAEALARSGPPFKLIELPTIDAKRAERVLAEAHEAITELADEVARIETAGPNEHEAFALAFAAVVPQELAAALVRTIGTDEGAPLMKDRPRLLAEARARLRQAELLERAALAAMGDPRDRLSERSDSDPLLTILAEAGR